MAKIIESKTLPAFPTGGGVIIGRDAVTAAWDAARTPSDHPGNINVPPTESLAL